jgi:hypothetical protein
MKEADPYEPMGYFLPEGAEADDFLEVRNKMLAARDAVTRLPKSHRAVLDRALKINNDDGEYDGEGVKGYLEGLLYVLNDFAGIDSDLSIVRERRRGRPPGAADWRLHKIVSTVFTLAKRHGGDLSFNKHKDDGGDDFRQAWKILGRLFPEDVPDELTDALVAAIDRLKWPPRKVDNYRG